MFGLVRSGLARGGCCSIRSIPLAKIRQELSLLPTSGPVAVGCRVGGTFLGFAVLVHAPLGYSSS